MISVYMANDIRNLLAEGALSQRKIAKQLGVSRGTVNAIALGKRTDRMTPRRSLDDDQMPTGPVKRCPECGYMVIMPCLACRIRAMKRRMKGERRRAKGEEGMMPDKL